MEHKFMHSMFSSQLKEGGAQVNRGCTVGGIQA